MRKGHSRIRPIRFPNPKAKAESLRPTLRRIPSRRTIRWPCDVCTKTAANDRGSASNPIARAGWRSLRFSVAKTGRAVNYAVEPNTPAPASILICRLNKPNVSSIAPAVLPPVSLTESCLPDFERRVRKDREECFAGASPGLCIARLDFSSICEHPANVSVSSRSQVDARTIIRFGTEFQFRACPNDRDRR